MEKVKIFIRTDLKTNSNKRVPNGKLAAQSAHACMAGFLSLFERSENKLIPLKENKPLIEAFVNNKIEIEYLPIKEKDLESVLEEENLIKIIDQGRTVFREPTLTTMIKMPKGYTYNQYIDCGAEQNERYRSKQTIIINKPEIKDKWEMFEVVTESSMKSLYSFLNKELELELKEEGLKAWISGAFAKITLQPTDVTIEELEERLLNQTDVTFVTTKKENKISSITVNPNFVEIVDQHTKEGLKLV